MTGAQTSVDWHFGQTGDAEKQRRVSAGPASLTLLLQLPAPPFRRPCPAVMPVHLQLIKQIQTWVTFVLTE